MEIPVDIISEPENGNVENDALASGSESSDNNESVYYNSSDVCSYYSETDEDVPNEERKREKTKIVFDPNSKIHVFCLGMKFKNVEEVRDAVSRYAVMKGLYVHFMKNDHNRVRAECKKGCP